jgi:hypothetical protein
MVICCRPVIGHMQLCCSSEATLVVLDGNEGCQLLGGECTSDLYICDGQLRRGEK